MGILLNYSGDFKVNVNGKDLLSGDNFDIESPVKFTLTANESDKVVSSGRYVIKTDDIYNGSKYGSYEGDSFTIDFSKLNLTGTPTKMSFYLPTFADKVQQEVNVQYTENLIGCTSSLTGSTEVKSSKTPIKVTFNCNEGYTFTKSGNFVCKDSLGNTDIKDFFPPDGSTTFTTELETYGKLSEPTPYLSITANLTATKNSGSGEAPDQASRFSNLYKVDNDILEQLSNKRYSESDVGETKDKGKYITGLYIFPYSLPDNYLTDDENIILGRDTTDIKAQRIDYNKISINVGSINIKEKYNNVIDYKSDITLFLPFCDSIKLEPSKVMNKTINIKYNVELYSGSTTVVITVDDIIIESKKFNIDYQIPFIQFDSGDTINKITSLYVNNIKKPYVVVYRDIPVNKSNGYSTNETGKLLDYKGFITVDKIKLITKANISEQDEIKSILNEGVIING